MRNTLQLFFENSKTMIRNFLNIQKENQSLVFAPIYLNNRK